MTQLKYGVFALSTWMLAAVPPVLAADEAEDDELAEVRLLGTPASSVTAGAAYSSDDLTQLGRYNGRDDSGAYLLLNFDINRRDDETGTWTLVDGRNVGMSNRWLRYERNRQGNWKYFIEFDQLDTVNPYLFDTDLTGIGSDQMATGGTSTRRQFSQQRQNLKMGMGKQLSKGLDFRLSYRHEQKEGERNWGTGGRPVGGSFGSFFLVEPIDYRTQEVEATMDYTTEKLQLRGGYLLSLFDNPTEKLALDIGSIDANAQAIETATPPDNHSQLLFLSGGYRVSDRTRGTFKVSYQQDRQDETFYQSNPFNNRSDLGGKVDTFRVNLGMASRVNADLTLNAKLRYEDRDDNTPQARYISTFGQVNQLTSRTTTNGTLDATYRLQPGTSLTGGVEYDLRRRDPVDEPNMARREKNDETTFHVGGRKKLSEMLQGSVRLSHSEREGSLWLSGSGIEAGTLLTAPVAFDYVNSLQYADRTRDQLRVMLDWYPMEEWSVQWVLEGSQERYSGLPLGPREGDSLLASVDTAYQLSDEWSLNGWLSANRRALDASTHSWIDIDVANFATAYNDSQQTWSGESIDRGYALGLGVKGVPSDELKLGGSLQYSKDTSEFDMASIAPPADAQYAPASALPTIKYTLVQLKLYGEYALDEQQGMRLDYRYDRITNNDWTWNNHTDYFGTTVTQADNESNHYIGLSYYYRGW